MDPFWRNVLQIREGKKCTVEETEINQTMASLDREGCKADRICLILCEAQNQLEKFQLSCCHHAVDVAQHIPLYYLRFVESLSSISRKKSHPIQYRAGG